MHFPDPRRYDVLGDVDGDAGMLHEDFLDMHDIIEIGMGVTARMMAKDRVDPLALLAEPIGQYDLPGPDVDAP